MKGDFYLGVAWMVIVDEDGLKSCFDWECLWSRNFLVDEDVINEGAAAEASETAPINVLEVLSFYFPLCRNILASLIFLSLLSPTFEFCEVPEAYGFFESFKSIDYLKCLLLPGMRCEDDWIIDPIEGLWNMFIVVLSFLDTFWMGFRSVLVSIRSSPKNPSPSRSEFAVFFLGL